MRNVVRLLLLLCAAVALIAFIMFERRIIDNGTFGKILFGNLISSFFLTLAYGVVRELDRKIYRKQHR